MKSASGRPSATKTGSRLLPAAAGLVALLAGVASADTEEIPISDEVYGEWSAIMASAEPEPLLNDDEALFPRAGVRAIVQNDGHMNVARTAQNRHLVKRLFIEAILQSSGTIHGYLQSEVLHGVEFDVFADATNIPRPGQFLTVVGQLVWGVVPNQVLIGQVYCYDVTQYTTRYGDIQAVIGHPLHHYPVWADNPVTCSGTSMGFRLPGDENLFYGKVASADGMRIQGTENVLHDGGLYVTEIDIDPNNSVDPMVQVSSVPIPGLPMGIENARSLAQTEGTYFSGDGIIVDTDPPPEGIVFAEGDIYVVGSAMEGCWSFVSATGKIVFSGCGNLIHAHTQNFVAWSYVDEVKVSGDDNDLRGELLAPQYRVMISGEGNQVRGILLGDYVTVSGTDNTISDGTHPYLSTQ